MTAIEAPEPACGITPPSEVGPDADQTALPIPTAPASGSTRDVDDENSDQVRDPALDLAERLVALQYGNPAQRDLAQFALQVIATAENTDITTFDDDEDHQDENGDTNRGNGDAAAADDERDTEPIPADVLAYRAGVAGIDAYESLASALQAGKARLIAHAQAYSRAALRHGDLTLGHVIQHADGAVDRVMTGTQILATDLAVVLHAPTGLVGNQITEATQLVRYMPKTLARLESGELTEYHWRLISSHVHRTTDDLEVLDEVVSGRSFRGTGSYTGLGEDRATTTAVKRRLDRALARIGDEPPSSAKRKSGFAARYVGIGPVGDDGMSSLHGLVPAVHARAIDTLLSDLATTAPEGDERTVEQRRADAFLTLFTGPAALAPPLQTQLDLGAASFDEEGQFTVVDPQQNLSASETWETIRLLAASLGLTFPDVPRAVINLDVTAETLNHAHHHAARPAVGSPPPGHAAQPRGHADHGSSPGGYDSSEPDRSNHCYCGSTAQEHRALKTSDRPSRRCADGMCPDSTHDRRPPSLLGVETPQDADATSTNGCGAHPVPYAPTASIRPRTAPVSMKTSRRGCGQRPSTASATSPTSSPPGCYATPTSAASSPPPPQASPSR